MKIRCEYKKLVPLSELKPHLRNRNKHSEDQIARLAQIFEYQGIRHPIIVSNLSGFIVAGHGRLEAAKKLGLTEFPVDYQDFSSEEEEYAFLVSDNSIALWAELDLAGINADMPDLGPDFDIDLLGLKEFELEPADLPEIDTDAERLLQQMTFTLSNAQVDTVKQAMAMAKELGHIENEENENSNGNALARVCELFLLNNGNG